MWFNEELGITLMGFPQPNPTPPFSGTNVTMARLEATWISDAAFQHVTRQASGSLEIVSQQA
jgi:hypothetical protein